MKITKHFTLQEFACHDANRTEPAGSALENVKELAKNLEVLREHTGKAIIINSGYRTIAYNEKQKGHSKVSQHLYGKAADIVIPGMTPEEVAVTIEKLIAAGEMKKGGVGRYNNFTHYDIRGTQARWNYRT
ncbi:YcbK family protein [Flavobacterium psychrotrophum]|uniref:YcbK family protein n=1 Tax=Flavobacterium psychrotrophum TaxID=2294119 RepID=UPI000E30F0C4|nr:D-Ala-D-Ala carboxypeptidase family metallohydrolase [Flavobacterium psychrotrophum]